MSTAATTSPIEQLLTAMAAGRSPTPAQVRALALPHLEEFSDGELTMLVDHLVARMQGDLQTTTIAAKAALATVSDPFAARKLLTLLARRRQAAADAVAAVASGNELSLEIRDAFGALSSAHVRALQGAIRSGDITQGDLEQAAGSGAYLNAKLRDQLATTGLWFETRRDVVNGSRDAAAERTIDAPVQVVGRQGRFTLMVSNGMELWRAATFQTKEAETVDWLDTTFGQTDCLYDVGANIGLYSLYALAKTQQARAICFEPDPVNFYRLSQNVAVNGFGPRAIVCPVALSDVNGFVAFTSSLLVAGKAENWIGPASELLDGASQTERGAPFKLRTGCQALCVDDFIAAAPDMPRPTHLKIDVDFGDLRILRGAGQTLRHRELRHVLIELNVRDLGAARDLLVPAGFRHLRSARHNTVPRRDGWSGNHIFTKD